MIAASERYVHPAASPCPACGSGEWSAAGHSRSFFVRYRRCNACEMVFKILPQAVETVGPDGRGRIKLLPE